MLATAQNKNHSAQAIATADQTAEEAAATVETSWHIVEHMTQEMRIAAAASDWQHVLNLAGDRHRELLRHFERFPVGPQNANFYRVRLHDMLRGEQDMQIIATDARREVLRAGLLTNRNYRAASAYLSS